MLKALTKFPLFAWFGKVWKGLSEKFGGGKTGDHKSLTIKIVFGILAIGMALTFNTAFQQYADESQKLVEAGAEANLQDYPGMLPMAGKGVGAAMALIAFFVSLWIRESGRMVTRHRLLTIALWVACLGGLLAWLPTDIIATQSALAGKALAGENSSIPAYVGKIVLIGFLIISPPIVVQMFFRLGLMDQYVVKAFLSPFTFCMMAFTSIWLIFDFTDNGPAFSGLPFSRLAEFYIVQFPYVILFVLPIVILLSLLFALSTMSKSNELISMISAGRSVLRILAPLLFIGVYTSVISLALKYDWAPRAVGLKEAILQNALSDQAAKHSNSPPPAKGLWSKSGWMHVNDFASRTWFVGLVPWELSKPMGNVIIWKRDAEGQPITMWQAREASWNWESETSDWTLKNGRVWNYHKDKIPRPVPFDTLTLSDWNETPWKVLSSSQNPEFLGMPGLKMYLNANREMADKDLASFRTNLWNIFAEPATCFAMVLVAAPLGIVYSRKGVLGGVTAAVIIFALMYIMKGTTMALGQGNRISPFMGAWVCNFIVAGIGIVLLWFRSRNRDVPKLSKVLLFLVTFGKVR
ncbi:MAG: LptF/LptG family permease [Verrucomicrobiales bacterium]|nr:LptF/LptG family permease [Verrucomicrobiales bacterium]